MAQQECTYCGSAGRLTREHVWPDCLLSRTGRNFAHFAHKTGAVHGADYVVRDVCQTCNNTRLTDLDAYFCRLYDAYFRECRDFGSVVEFRYDYELLSRALLKIAYNSARSASTPHAPFLPLRDTILGLETMSQRFAVFAELVSPALVPDATEPTRRRKVMPGPYRSGVTKLLTPHGNRVHTRIVAVNSFYFHLVIAVGEGAEDVAPAADELEQSISGVVRLVPGQDGVVLRSSPQDGVLSMAPHVVANREAYAAYFARQKKARDE